jgi:hypothetical protein
MTSSQSLKATSLLIFILERLAHKRGWTQPVSGVQELILFHHSTVTELR